MPCPKRTARRGRVVDIPDTPSYVQRRSLAAKKIQSAFRSKSAPKKVKAVKKIANEQIKRSKETHTVIQQNNLAQYNNLPNSTADLIELLPPIHQVGQTVAGGPQVANLESREGSKVHMTSLRVKGIAFIPANDTPNSTDRALIACRLIAFSSDRFRNFDALRNEWATGENLHNRLLMQGATPVPFDGTMKRIWLPVNSNSFTTHYDKTWIFNRGQLISQSSLPTSTEGLGMAHMCGVYRNININLKVKNKLLTFPRPSDYYPSNYGPALIFMFAYVNGAPPSASAVPFMQVSSTARFKDD